MTMTNLFLKLVNMSVSAGWLIIAVVCARLLLKKAPKAVRLALWLIVGIRLVCPFTLESALSLIPSAETVPSRILYSEEPGITSGMKELGQRG